MFKNNNETVVYSTDFVNDFRKLQEALYFQYMDINDFQKKALESVALTEKDVAALAHRTLGLTGEAGILANQIKKIIRDKEGKADSEDIDVIKKRLGDVLYYTAVLAEYFDVELSGVAEQNISQSAAFKETRSPQ